jgi:hypothetical protein
MVHLVENEEIEIAEISGDCEIDDLPATVFKRAIVATPPFQYQIERARRVAFGDQVASRRDDDGGPGGEASKFPAIGIGQGREFLEPASGGFGMSG